MRGWTMKPKPIKKIKQTKKPNQWAYDYLNTLRQQMGNDEFTRLVRALMIEQNARALMVGKSTDERAKIAERAAKALEGV